MHLAWSLMQIMQGGADAFYKGEIARRIVADHWILARTDSGRLEVGCCVLQVACNHRNGALYPGTLAQRNRCQEG